MKKEKIITVIALLLTLALLFLYISKPASTGNVIKQIKCSTITQHGITWTFDREYTCGQFINGDWWVIGPLTIIEITPNASAGRNGWMVNPISTQQSYDNRGTDYNQGLLPTLPYLANPDESIIKTISNQGTSCSYNIYEACYLNSVAVLSILSSQPQIGSFRPAFFGTNKHLYNTNELQLGLLPSLQTPTNIQIPTLTEIKNHYEAPQLDLPGWSRRPLHPENALPNYGGDIARRTGDSALRLMLNDSIQQKMPALINYIQAGIDYYSFVNNGISYGNSGGGGHENGRKIPILFAGILLDDQNMKSSVKNANREVFGEKKIAKQVAPIPLAAQQNCSEQDYWRIIHNVEPGSKTCADPYNYIDGGYRPNYDGYQATYSNTAVGSTLAAMLLPGGRNVWNDETGIQYLDRWLAVGTHTQPDICAPVPGICSGGTNQGTPCSSASRDSLTNNPCQGGGECILTTNFPPAEYGITYGPDGQGGCIQDNDPSDGTGRFPAQHNTGPGGGYSSEFAETMWTLYATPNTPEIINTIVAYTNSCTETDNGPEYYIQGSIEGTFYTNNTSYSGTVNDGCLNNNILLETICGSSIDPSLQGYAGIAYIDCSTVNKTCSNGVCN